VFGIVVDVDFAAVVWNAVAVPITSQTARDGAEPIAAAGRRRLGKRAWNTGVGCASGLRFGLGYALVATELLMGRTFPILQVVEVDGDRTSGKAGQTNQEQHAKAHILKRTHAQNSVASAN
jgi:hypothetical protein